MVSQITQVVNTLPIFGVLEATSLDNDHKNNAGGVTRGIELPINSWRASNLGHGETRGNNDKLDRFSNVELSGDGTSLIVGAWDASYARIYGINNSGNWEVEAGPIRANQSTSNPLIGTGYGYGTGSSYYKSFRDWYGQMLTYQMMVL